MATATEKLLEEIRDVGTRLAVRFDDAKRELEESQRHKSGKDDSLDKQEALVMTLCQKVENLEKELEEAREASSSSILELKNELGREKSAREEKEKEMVARLEQAEKALVEQKEEIRKTWEAIPDAVSRHPTSEDMKIVKAQSETTTMEVVCSVATKFGFMRLASMTRVKSVTLHGPADGAAIALLSLMPSLEELKVHLIAEHLLPEIGKLSALRRLELHQTQGATNWLEHLTGMSSLQSLVLSQHRDHILNSMVHVAKIPRLEHLDISAIRVWDDDLVPLTSLTRLTWLSLPRFIGDRGLQYLQNFKALKTLLLRSPITDYSVECLKALSWIEKVGLNDSQTIATMRRAFPDLELFII
ncbi:hypothetical protein CLOM_g11640 [Closterium sp. NIES-68]|nr:hypothetical protein CLOM_g11640 [Closterium sp. NIES-68]GJP78222.1 hypothetical protein CLOP_g8552 [Closterium sp. NIES-67]GJP84320.1 hypothetical protein CLOP_g14380 [Closterium sp. NIES-67]